MVMENKQSLEVDYQLLAKECHALAYFLPEVPTQVGFDYNQFFYILNVHFANKIGTLLIKTP